MSGLYAAAAGTAISAYGKIKSGYAQKSALDAGASELTQEAGQSVAAGIQGAIADRRRGAYVASNAQARIAGGGLATTGTSAEAVIGGIKGQSEYDAQTALYQGYDRASELNFRAGQMRTQGSNAVTGGWIGGAASVLTGGTSFYDHYSPGTPLVIAGGAGGGGIPVAGGANFSNY
jgi:hypothetical protein